MPGPPYAQAAPPPQPGAAAFIAPGVQQGQPAMLYNQQFMAPGGPGFNGQQSEGGKSREFVNPDGVVFLVTGDAKNVAEDLVKSLAWSRLNGVGRVGEHSGRFEKEGTRMHAQVHDHILDHIKGAGGQQIDGWFRCPVSLWNSPVVQEPKKLISVLEGKTLFGAQSAQLVDFLPREKNTRNVVNTHAKLCESVRNFARFHGLVTAGVLPAEESKALYDMSDSLVADLEAGQLARYATEVEFLKYVLERLIREFEQVKLSPSGGYPISGGLDVYAEDGSLLTVGLASIFKDLAANLRVSQDTLLDYKNASLYLGTEAKDGSEEDEADEGGGKKRKKPQASKSGKGSGGTKDEPPPKQAGSSKAEAHCLAFAVGKCTRGDACSFQHAFEADDGPPKSVLKALAGTRVHDQGIMTAKAALFEEAEGRSGIKLTEDQKKPLVAPAETATTATRSTRSRGRV